MNQGGSEREGWICKNERVGGWGGFFLPSCNTAIFFFPFLF